MHPASLAIRPGEPGCRRNVLIDPRPGTVRTDIEDDFHSFWLELDHDGEQVLDLRTGAVRAPWTTCPDAGLFLAQRMRGQRLDALAVVDSALIHCTHQHDLALMAAAHAAETEPTLYRAFVSDEKEPFRTAELYRNDRLILDWQLVGSRIVSPGPGHGESLRRLRDWLGALPVPLQEPARILRRTVFLADGRAFDRSSVVTADQLVVSTGACYTFQPDRSPSARITMAPRDFTDGDVPLRARIGEAALPTMRADPAAPGREPESGTAQSVTS